MGLDTTHNAWHGSYSSFMEFRSGICSHLGIEIFDLSGYGGGTPIRKAIKDEGLFILINHSDCDGELTPEECKKVADSLIKIWRKQYPDSSFSKQLKQFIDGCLLAYSKNETLYFH